MEQPDHTQDNEQQPLNQEQQPTTSDHADVQEENGDKTDSDSPKKKKTHFKPNKDINKLLRIVIKYRVAVIMIFIGGLLTLTALKMLHYSDPPADDARIQENLSKFKKIRIDQKTVQRIDQLQDSQVAPGTSIENGRTNPFAE
jgi:hypothetical protein